MTARHTYLESRSGAKHFLKERNTVGKNSKVYCVNETVYRKIEDKVVSNKETQYFVEEGTVEFFNNNLAILSSTIIEMSALSKEKISKMIEESKNQLNQENLDDKKRYVVSHKIDCLSRINL